MWPYWLDGHAPNTVKNSFDMSSMYLLTGIAHFCVTKIAVHSHSKVKHKASTYERQC